MSAAGWTAVGAVGAVLVTIAIAACGLGWWLYRRGGHQGKLTASIDAATEAVERNTRATADLSVAFTAHKARTDTRLDEHQRMLVQHDKRLSAGGI